MPSRKIADFVYKRAIQLKTDTHSSIDPQQFTLFMHGKKHISKRGSTKFLVKRHKNNYGCGVIESRTIKTFTIRYILGNYGL